MSPFWGAVGGSLKLLAVTLAFAFACGLPDSWHLLGSLASGL